MSGRLVLLALAVCRLAASGATVVPTSPTPSPAPPTAELANITTAIEEINRSIGPKSDASFNASLLPEEPWFPYRPLLMECFPRLSWTCFQTKMLLYLDQLNRARRVRILGDIVTLEKTRPDHTPPLTEELLAARHIKDQASLIGLLELVTDRFLDTHVIRLDLPAWDGARLVSEPVEIGFVVSGETDTGFREGRGKKKGGGGKKKKGGKKMMKMMMGAGKKMVEMVGKMMFMKMMMMVPIAMKKGMIGGMAGLMSMGMMKFMLIQKVMSLLKSKCGGGGGGGGGGCDDPCGGGGGGGGDGGCDSGGGGGGYGRIEWARHDAAYRGGYPTVASPVAPYYQHAQPPHAYDYWRQPPRENTWTMWR